MDFLKTGGVKLLDKLLLMINLLLEDMDEKDFQRKIIALEDWIKDVSCLYTRGFGQAIVLSLKEENNLVKARRLLRKYKKQVKKEIAINDEK